jgi:hypothetical protein
MGVATSGVWILVGITIVLWFARGPLPGLRDLAVLVRACSPAALLEVVLRAVGGRQRSSE